MSCLTNCLLVLSMVVRYWQCQAAPKAPHIREVASASVVVCRLQRFIYGEAKSRQSCWLVAGVMVIQRVMDRLCGSWLRGLCTIASMRVQPSQARPLCDDRNVVRPKVPLLSRDKVVHTALAIIDDAGLEGLTVSRLASRIGVHHASLYHHYTGKDAILDDVIRFILPDVVEPAADDDLLEWMVRNALTYRRMLQQHPNMLPLMARRPHRSTMLVYQQVVTRLMGLGMTKASAEAILEAYEALILGYSFMETGGLAPRRPRAVLKRFENALRALLDSLLEAATMTRDVAAAGGHRGAQRRRQQNESSSTNGAKAN